MSTPKSHASLQVLCAAVLGVLLTVALPYSLSAQEPPQSRFGGLLGTLNSARGISSQNGANVIVSSGENGWLTFSNGTRCLTGSECEVALNGEESVEFTVNPRVGYEFAGWNLAGQAFCDQGSAVCKVASRFIKVAEAIEPIYAAEGSIFYPGPEKLWVCIVQSLGGYNLDCTVKDFIDYGEGSIADYVVTNPDVLFVDIEQRRSELAQLPEQTRDTWCGNDPNYFEDPGRDVDVEMTPPTPSDIWDDDTLNAFQGPLQFARVYYQYLDDEASARFALRGLKAYAEAQTWLDVDISTDGENRHYNLGIHARIYLTTWATLRDSDLVSESDRVLIDEYLHDLALFLTEMNGRAAGLMEPDLWGDVTNHQFPRDHAVMMYGIMTSNDALFQIGIKRFFGILEGVYRPDGSNKYESQRAGAALYYSIIATSDMIRYAELAANQGYDLYSVEVNGLSLHDIIEYHVSVLLDETLMHPYSTDNLLFCGDEQLGVGIQCDLSRDLYNEQVGWSRDRGWPEFEVYRRRFPGRPVVDMFRTLFPDDEHVTLQEGPIFQGCEVRDVSTAN